MRPEPRRTTPPRRPAFACAALMLALCAPVLAAAQSAAGNPENWCRNGAFPEEAEFRLARLVGPAGARVHFLTDSDDCPNAANPACVSEQSVVPGDRVLVSRQYGDWFCSWHQPRSGGEIVGWLPAASLLLSDPDPIPQVESWAGTWKYGDQSLVIKLGDRAGSLVVEGRAYWPGRRTDYPSVHTGGVGASSEPLGNTLVLREEEDGCEVVLKLIGPFVVATDNGECGGANVRFNGVYVRRAPVKILRRRA